MAKAKDELDEAMRSEMGLGEEFDLNKKPTDANETEEEVKQDADEEETESTDEGEEEVETEHPTKGIPPREFNKLRTELRELKEKLLEKDQKLQEVEKPLVTEEELNQAAKELSAQNATPEQINATKASVKRILDLAWRGAKISAEDKQKLDTLNEKLAEIEDEKSFAGDWEKFEGDIEKQYPKANVAQIREAKQAMDELSHAPQFADKELDYVFFKNKDIFDEILSPVRKKTFESRETYIPPEEEGEHEPTFEEIKEQARQQDTWNVSHDGDTYKV